jgi:GT2 family glycosyltransferase
MPAVKATVVIVNWNGGAYLRQCLLALQGQTEPSFVAVVADNGSTDGSDAEVESLDDPRFSLLRLGVNKGFAVANNRAVQHSTAGEWIALLNPDAFADPNWLACLLQAAERDPQAASFGARLVNADNPLMLDGTGDVYDVSGRVWRRDHGVPMSARAELSDDIFSPCAAAALYRRDAWDAAAGFDEDFFCYVEDVDLGFRMRLLGYRSVYVPDAICRHVGSGITGRHSDFADYHGQRNLVWTFVKNMPGALFWLLLPLHLLLNVAALFMFASRGQGRVVLRAKCDAVRGLPRTWRKRQQVQATRKVGLASLWKILHKGFGRRSGR